MARSCVLWLLAMKWTKRVYLPGTLHSAAEPEHTFTSVKAARPQGIQGAAEQLGRPAGSQQQQSVASALHTIKIVLSVVPFLWNCILARGLQKESDEFLPWLSGLLLALAML